MTCHIDGGADIGQLVQPARHTAGGKGIRGIAVGGQIEDPGNAAIGRIRRNLPGQAGTDEVLAEDQLPGAVIEIGLMPVEPAQQRDGMGGKHPCAHQPVNLGHFAGAAHFLNHGKRARVGGDQSRANRLQVPVNEIGSRAIARGRHANHILRGCAGDVQQVTNGGAGGLPHGIGVPFCPARLGELHPVGAAAAGNLVSVQVEHGRFGHSSTGVDADQALAHGSLLPCAGEAPLPPPAIPPNGHLRPFTPLLEARLL